MKKSNPTTSLNEAIILLEIKRDSEFKALKEQFNSTYESLKPINLVKSLLHELTSSPDLKGSMSSAAIGIASGYLMKRILFRSTMNPIKNLAGVIIQQVVTNLAATNSDRIKSIGEMILEKLTSIIKPHKEETFVNEFEEVNSNRKI